MEADRNAYKLQQAGLGAGAGRAGKENALPHDAPGGDPATPQDVGFIRGYLNRIAQLEKEIRRLKEVCCFPFTGIAVLQLADTPRGTGQLPISESGLAWRASLTREQSRPHHM